MKRRREVHWKSRYAPQLPAEEQQQQQQQEAGTDELDFDSARGLPTRPHAGTANIKAYNAKMDKLRENGYLRARMVRVRLLHYFICRLVGELSFLCPSPTVPGTPSQQVLSTMRFQIVRVVVVALPCTADLFLIQPDRHSLRILDAFAVMAQHAACQ